MIERSDQGTKESEGNNEVREGEKETRAINKKTEGERGTKTNRRKGDWSRMRQKLEMGETKKLRTTRKIGRE